MEIAIRYFSKSGRTKRIAETFGRELGIAAASIEAENGSDIKADLLFIGGAPYANIMAPELNTYVSAIRKENVKKAVLFTTSNWSLRTVKAMRQILEKNGIEVLDESFNANAFKMDAGEKEAVVFARKIKEKYINCQRCENE